MTISETEILIRNDRVRTIRDQIIKLLSELNKKFDFNRAEMLLAFNEVNLIQWDIDKYLSTMR